MEYGKLFGNPASLSWQLSDAPAPPELNSGPPADQLPPPCFLSLNWDPSMDQSAHFESALSSLVSSPSSAAPATESLVIKELIGRLSSICNSGEISPTSRYHSASTSCYSTPLNSPPKLNLPMIDPHQLQHGRRGLPPISRGPSPAAHLAPLSADPGFSERAARFSCFGGDRNCGSGLTGQFRLPEAGKLSKISSSQSLKAGGSQMRGVSESGNELLMQDGIQLEMGMRSRFSSSLSGSLTADNGEFGSAAQEESSASDRTKARKRKAAPKGNGKEAPLSSAATNPPKVAEEKDLNAKRYKSSETNGAEMGVPIKPKAEQNGGATTSGDANKKQGKESNVKPREPPKDYIHVRARRGQATDSHSLAERVRREKISKRMKFLQDLVPGCNKVTGKAVMLDEIINYVQSLQRQVEFLSMKLAAVTPRLDFINTENFILKEMYQVCGPMPPHSVYPLETTTSMAFKYAQQPQGTSLQSIATNGLETQYSVNPLDSCLRQTLSMQLPSLDGFGDPTSQLGTFWEEDLHSVVQMGSGQNQEAALSSQSFHGSLPTSHMKIEF